MITKSKWMMLAPHAQPNKQTRNTSWTLNNCIYFLFLFSFSLRTAANYRYYSFRAETDGMEKNKRENHLIVCKAKFSKVSQFEIGSVTDPQFAVQNASQIIKRKKNKSRTLWHSLVIIIDCISILCYLFSFRALNINCSFQIVSFFAHSLPFRFIISLGKAVKFNYRQCK